MPYLSDCPSSGSCNCDRQYVGELSAQVSGGTARTASVTAQPEVAPPRLQGRITPPLPPAAFAANLAAKRAEGDIVQPTAVLATAAFADSPIFRAVETVWQSEQRPLHSIPHPQLIAERMDVERMDRASSEAPSSLQQEEVAPEEETDTASSPRHRQNKSPWAEQLQSSEQSLSRSPAEGASESDHAAGDRPKKRRKISSADRLGSGMAKLAKLLHQNGKEVVTLLQQSNSTLLQHLQEQRHAEENFRRELLAMERERSKSDREAVGAIAAAIVGHLTGLNRNASMDSRPESATTSHHAFRTSSFPFAGTSPPRGASAYAEGGRLGFQPVEPRRGLAEPDSQR